MLIKNTNPNELLEEFERDGNFCPYNEEELERLKKEGEQLRKNVTCSIGISHNGVWLGYDLSNITDKGVCYEYEKYGSLSKILSTYSEKWAEYIRFEDFGKTVFFYKSTNSDCTVWSIEVERMSDYRQDVRLWIGEKLVLNKSTFFKKREV